MSFEQDKRREFGQAKRKLRYPDFQALTSINNKVVALTANKHAYDKDDERRLRELLDKVKETANTEQEPESIVDKASLLLHQIARGQYFYEGNKRTAFETTKVFLRANGYTMDIRDKDLLQVVDRVATGQAGLNEVKGIMRRLVRKI